MQHPLDMLTDGPFKIAVEDFDLFTPDRVPQSFICTLAANWGEIGCAAISAIGARLTRQPSKTGIRIGLGTESTQQQAPQDRHTQPASHSLTSPDKPCLHLARPDPGGARHVKNWTIVSKKADFTEEKLR